MDAITMVTLRPFMLCKMMQTAPGFCSTGLPEVGMISPEGPIEHRVE
jgi:hypothetical protein